MRILHIHSNPLFIDLIKYYEHEALDNKCLFLGKFTNRKPVDYQINNTLHGLNETLKIANTFDIVILYDLDYAKSYIANRINSNIPVLWRFFGYELYDKITDVLYSDKTKKIQKTQKPKFSIKRFIRNRILGGYSFRYKNVDMAKELKKAMGTIDFFHCLSEEEYNFLKKHFDLPQFLHIPYQINLELTFNKKNGNRIIVGNNRSSYNNHFEIVDIVAKYPEIEKISFLNYGTKKHYFYELMEVIKPIENFKAITNFLPLKKFEEYYDTADAFVLNGYRQMATGNIAAAFQYGVKVYLNANNPYYHLLLNNGFLVFDVEELDEDLKNGNFTLTWEQAEHNVKAVNNLNKISGIGDFYAAVREIVKEFSEKTGPRIKK